MKIKGRTILQFLPLFLRVQNPNKHISNTNITTTYNILTSYVQLILQKKQGKISVKDLISRAGYSRTTFYSYFTDVQDVHNTLAEIISYHMFINSDVYFLCFLGKVTPAEEKEILMTIQEFSPYIHALNIHSPTEYTARYIKDFNDAFSKTVYVKEIPEATRPYLLNALCAAMVALITDTFDDTDNNISLSLQKAMNCAKLLIQSFIDIDPQKNDCEVNK